MRLSRKMRHVAALSFCVAMSCSLARAADRADVAATSEDNGASPAAKLVRQALEAEAAGDAERRDSYLTDALAADPDYAPAHWQSSEVRTGERWLTIADSAAATMREGKVAQYRQMRDRAAHTGAGQLSLRAGVLPPR